MTRLILLRAGAFNPIGRLRIREAMDYFDAHSRRHEKEEAAKGFSQVPVDPGA